MKKQTALYAVFGIGLFGMLFSGYLSYGELFGSCTAGCPSPGEPGTLFGYPACVYGFVMYTIVTVIAGLGAFSKK